jgi:glycosyltransferase involved in cell wall biosynthesis
VIGVSQSIVDRHGRFFPDAITQVIRHPLRHSATNRDPKTPPEVIGYLGRLEHEKGVDLILSAAAEYGLRIRIAGSGRARERVEDAARAGLVEYVGVVRGRAKAHFLESCDAGVVPSAWLEPGGPPYTVLEWLAARRAVLVTPVGGLREAAGRYNGILAFTPTAAGLAAALAHVTAPAEVRDDSDVERWLDEHEQVYDASR